MDWQSFAETPLQSADDMRRQITDKAISDDEFRSQLLSDPKAAISQELGVEVPEGLDIKIHESDMNTLHLALPSTDLNEEQLEAIAAGRCCC
ncbi:MAG: NHLP leader peptide family RiPP precursor [Gammaproteobacteria bacterium]|nr:NHLP leader peptide family RiPP precursor [Gammaproteobacteria bacterium]MCY4357255.1 NHLP leader peptide family RiPP precursor [Gammaproteobacteria bacterium]